MKKNGLDIAQQLLNALIGMSPSRVKLGQGSFITFDFGKDIFEEIKTKSGTKTVCFGEWHLWIYMCAWRIDRHGEPLIGSEDSRTEIEPLLSLFNDQTLKSVTILNNAFDVTFSFSKDIDLHLFSINTKNDEQWLLYTPDENIFKAGPGNHWSYKNSASVN